MGGYPQVGGVETREPSPAYEQNDIENVWRVTRAAEAFGTLTLAGLSIYSAITEKTTDALWYAGGAVVGAAATALSHVALRKFQVPQIIVTQEELNL